MIKKAECIPLYWKLLEYDLELDLVECKSGNELEMVYNYIRSYGDISSLYIPPCYDMMATVNVDRKKIPWNPSLFAMELTYIYRKHQEIVNERYFSFETFWSSVGGLIGIFISYSLLEIPELLVGLFEWHQNLQVSELFTGDQEK